MYKSSNIRRIWKSFLVVEMLNFQGFNYDYTLIIYLFRNSKILFVVVKIVVYVIIAHTWKKISIHILIDKIL